MRGHSRARSYATVGRLSRGLARSVNRSVGSRQGVSHSTDPAQTVYHLRESRAAAGAKVASAGRVLSSVVSGNSRGAMKGIRQFRLLGGSEHETRLAQCRLDSTRGLAKSMDSCRTANALPLDCACHNGTGKASRGISGEPYSGSCRRILGPLDIPSRVQSLRARQAVLAIWSFRLNRTLDSRSASNGLASLLLEWTAQQARSC